LRGKKKKKKKKNRVKRGRILSNSFLKLLRLVRYEPCHFFTCSWDLRGEKKEENLK
jgi:hypothetical protein